MTIGVFSLSLLVACGQVTEAPSHTKKNVTYNSYSFSPLPLEKQSKGCFGQKFDSSWMNLKLFDGRDVTAAAYDYSNLLDNLFVRDREKKAINSSVYNHSLEYQILETLNGKVSYSGSEIQSALDITVCPDEDYHEDSVENAALSVNYFINKTYRGIKQASPDVKLPPIKLSIGPLIKISNLKERNQDVFKQSYYWVDNAAYSASSQTISFFPQSKESKMANRKTAYWQVPMVGSHEYGHHLFIQLYPYGVVNQNIDVCVDNRTLKEESLQESEPFTINNVINSFNEGFADLVATYTLAPNEVSLKGIECMEENREISSASFLDGTPKSFNPKVLFAIFNDEIEVYRVSCRQPDLRDIHYVGAIFAYFADSYLSVFTSSQSEKLSALIEWVKELRQNDIRMRTTDAEMYLKTSLQNFIKLAPKTLKKEMSPEACQKAEELYRGLTIGMTECPSLL